MAREKWDLSPGSLQATHMISTKPLLGLNPEAALKNTDHVISVLIMSSDLTRIVWFANGFEFLCFLTELVVGLPRVTPV